jgi:hypothetical protein
VVVRRQTPRFRYVAKACIALCFLWGSCLSAFGQNAASPDAGVGIVHIIVSLVILLGATAAFGWFFGHRMHRVPLQIGVAAIGAACGMGIGFSPDPAFATIVPALAAVFGGVLACTASVKEETRRVVSSGTAASAIPLILGIYFGYSLRELHTWHGDIKQFSMFLVMLAFVVVIGTWLGRRSNSVPLSFGGAALGGFIGLAMGLSTIPVVQYVVPASLTLFAAVAGYLFTAAPRHRHSIGGVLLSFGILFIIGQYLGIGTRLEYGWWGTSKALFGFGVLMSVACGLGAAAGLLHKKVIVGLGFTVLGGGVGLAVGLSRTPVIHIVIPVLLAVFGGISLYFFTAEKGKKEEMVTLLGAFALAFLLGTFLGSSLRLPVAADIAKSYQLELSELQGKVTDLQQQLDTLRSESAASGAMATSFSDLGRSLDALAGEINEVAEGVVTMAPDGDSDFHLYLEGCEVFSVVEVTATSALDAPVRIKERVDAAIRYDGRLNKGETISVCGESLEISWSEAEASGAIMLRGWDRMVRVDGGWTVEGEGESIDLDRAVRRDGRFFIVFP